MSMCHDEPTQAPNARQEDMFSATYHHEVGQTLQVAANGLGQKYTVVRRVSLANYLIAARAPRNKVSVIHPPGLHEFKLPLWRSIIANKVAKHLSHRAPFPSYAKMKRQYRMPIIQAPRPS